MLIFLALFSYLVFVPGYFLFARKKRWAEIDQISEKNSADKTKEGANLAWRQSDEIIDIASSNVRNLSETRKEFASRMVNSNVLPDETVKVLADDVNKANYSFGFSVDDYKSLVENSKLLERQLISSRGKNHIYLELLKRPYRLSKRYIDSKS